MKAPLSIIAILLINSYQAYCQNYPLLYENDFDKASTMLDFEFTDPSVWRLSDTLNNRSLELFAQSDYESRVRSPFNIALVKSVRVGNFVLEADLKQTGREYGHRDMCVFFGFVNATNFYYIHIASSTDQYAHNIFIVNDEPRTAISEKTTEGINWGDGWNKIRLERNMEQGTIKLFFNDMSQPIMQATDTHFIDGYVGFGSFDDTGMIDNIKLWGEFSEEKKGLFR